YGPAGIGARRADEAGAVGFDIADREAAGEVRQETIEGIADTAAHSAEPVILGLAVQPAAGGAGLDVGPVDVAFEAEHPRAAGALPVVAGGAADHAARRAIADGKAVPAGIAEAAAAVDAQVKTGPVVLRG